eukprot:SAG11_NODE_1629_length_4547_cov_2.310701_3_plen_138_part_00
MLFGWIEKRFGFDNFGVLTGLVLFVNGLLTMLIYPLATWIIADATGDAMILAPEMAASSAGGREDVEATFVPFDVWRRIWGGFLVGTVLSVLYPIWLWRRTQHSRQQHRARDPTSAQLDADESRASTDSTRPATKAP